MKHYHRLIQYPHFYMTFIPSPAAPLLYYYVILLTQKLYLHEKYIDLKDDPIELIKAINDDMQFWRMVLLEANDLLAEMVANAAVARNTAFLFDLVTNGVFNDKDILHIEEMLRPLSLDEIDISEAFVTELLSSANTIGALSAAEMSTGFGISWHEALSYKMLLQPNATQNMIYEQFNEFIRVAKLPGTEFANYMEMKKQENDRVDSWSPGIHQIYNPGGKLLRAIATADFDQYIARMHELGGFINLVGLYLQLMVDASDPESLVATSKYRNPYTDGPMHLDINSRTLSFECFNEALNCQINF